MHTPQSKRVNRQHVTEYVCCVQAYQEIENKFVIESIFSQFMYKTLPTCNHLFVFKKQFCMQMALSGRIHGW